MIRARKRDRALQARPPAAQPDDASAYCGVVNRQQVAYGDDDSELFRYLPLECLLRRLPRFDLPARELPQTAGRFLRPASAGEDAIPVGDDGGHDLENLHPTIMVADRLGPCHFFSGSFPQFISEYRHFVSVTSPSGRCAECRCT